MSGVERFYDQNAQYEWDRLDRHRIEFAVTMRAFGDYLPKPPAKILDIGGGPGRYAIALAQWGYEVTLVDISSHCLEFAKSKAKEAGVELAGCVHGDARDLARFPTQGCDVVLLMGPLYHLLTEGDRKSALHEAGRLLKPGGVMFAAFITRYAAIRFEGKHEPASILERQQWAEDILVTGMFRPWPGRGGFEGFTDAYLAHPSEIRPAMESGGFETLDVIACEGVVGLIDEQINALNGEQWQVWVDINYRLGRDPTVQGAADHLLCVGRKK